MTASSAHWVSKLTEAFSARRLALMPLLGFASGLPLALTAGTLQARLTTAGVDLGTIGLFSLVGVPYVVKFLWSPAMDRFVPPLLGRRRGWMLLTQLLLMAGIATLGMISPLAAPGLLGGVALLVAFVSASQDIAFDAYRTDVLQAQERGLGVALTVTGYRMGMLVSGAVALKLAEDIGWQSTYWLMALLMGVGLMATLYGPEPERAVKPPATLWEAVAGPLREFVVRPQVVALLALVVLYKLGDAFAGTLTTAFLLRGAGFSLGDVGLINKGLGLAALLVGALFGGTLMARLGLYRALLVFGLLQAVSNLSFMLLALAGKSYVLMMAAVGFENLAGGMGTAAFVALLMGLCDHRYTATQYALLSALAALGRVFVGPPSGYLAEAVGWANFFLLTTLVALPGLGLLLLLRGRIEALDRDR